MKRKLLLIVVLLLLFIAFVAIRFFFFDPKNSVGQIKIMSSPGAQVFINEVSVGKTPYTNTAVKVGEYRIKLISLGKIKNGVPWEGKVPIYKNSMTYISRELGNTELTSAGEILTIVKLEGSTQGAKGEVAVETDPSGAIVFLNNDEKGVAPLILKEVPVGDHELSVYLPGFIRKSQKVSVKKGYQVKIIYKLALDQAHRTLEEELETKRKEASKSAKAKEDEKKSAEDVTLTPTGEVTTTGKTLTILDTETGYLNVRSLPSTSGEVVTKVNPKEQYEYTSEENGWYFITLSSGDEGWVSGDYVKVE